jgi:alpha-beta hydrolase superfamily lysophospholipase
MMLSPIQETVTLNGGLVGDLSFAQDAGDWAVVWVHGFGSRRGGEKSQAVEAACSRRGWAFAAFDFRGHGQSSGQMRDLRAATLLEDLEAVRGHLASRGIRRLGLIGSSMGGFAAAWYALRAGRDVVPACVLLAPALRFIQARWETLSPEQREEWRITGVLPVQSDWVTAELGYGVAEERMQFPVGELAAKWDRPMLIFHGMRDTVIPYSTSVSFADTTACPDVELRLLKDGDHRLTAFANEIAEESCRFLERCR